MKYVVLSIINIFDNNFYESKKDQNPIFNITRSFDINKPGVKWNDVHGGILGGSLVCGTININDTITLFPGINNTPVTSKIISIKSENNQIDMLDTPGLVGLGTTLEPFYCKNDYLKGNFLAKECDIFKSKKIKIKNYIDNIFIDCVPKTNDLLKIIVNSNYYDCKITDVKKNYIDIISDKYIYYFKNQNIIICSFKPIKVLTCGYIN